MATFTLDKYKQLKKQGYAAVNDYTSEQEAAQAAEGQPYHLVVLTQPQADNLELNRFVLMMKDPASQATGTSKKWAAQQGTTQDPAQARAASDAKDWAATTAQQQTAEQRYQQILARRQGSSAAETPSESENLAGRSEGAKEVGQPTSNYMDDPSKSSDEAAFLAARDAILGRLQHMIDYNYPRELRKIRKGYNFAKDQILKAENPQYFPKLPDDSVHKAVKEQELARGEYEPWMDNHVVKLP